MSTTEDIISKVNSLYAVPNLGDNAIFLLDKIEKDVYKKVVSIIPEDYSKDFPISVISGTSEYALPTDFYNVKPLTCGLYRVDSNGKHVESYRARPSKHSPLTGYKITKINGKITMTPEPKADKDVVLVYIPKRATLTTSSTMILEDAEDYYALRLYIEYLNTFGDSLDAGLLNIKTYLANSMEAELLDLLRVDQPSMSLTLYRKGQL